MSAFEQRPLGRTGVPATTMGIGGVGLGERLERIEEATAVATVQAAYDLGIRYFDTSPWYGHGQSEHRMGHVLRNQPRDDFVLASKVGRVFFRPEAPQSYRPEVWAGGLPFDYRFDYTGDGIRRSYEDSLQRLGMNRIDLLLVHDLDLRFHETDDAMDRQIADLDAGGGWQVLADMRDRGEISGIGFGINFTGLIPRWLERFDPDFFLVAMPYTLLDQDALDDDLPLCAERNVGIVIGSVYSSGILATGINDNAVYRYGAPPADIVDKVRGMEAVCARHDVPLRAAALQFPLGHDSVAAIIPGAISPDQVRENATLLKQPIPADFWAELKAESLLRADAPTPQTKPRGQTGMAIQLTYGRRQQFRYRDRVITIRGQVAPLTPPLRHAVYRLNDGPETPFYVETIPDDDIDWVNGYKTSPAELRCRELGEFAIELPIDLDALRDGENRLVIDTADAAGLAASTDLSFTWDPTPPPPALDLSDLGRFDDIQAVGQVINGAFDLDRAQNLIRSRAPVAPDAFIILGGLYGSQEATYAVRFSDFTGVKWLGLADFFTGMEEGTPPRGIKVGWSSAGMATLNPAGEARSFIAWGDHSGGAEEWVVVTDPPKRFIVERQRRYRVRHQVRFEDGVTAVRFRLWPDGTPEPENWLVEEDDRAIPAHLPRHERAAFGLFQHSGMPIEWSDVRVRPLPAGQDLQS